MGKTTIKQWAWMAAAAGMVLTAGTANARPDDERPMPGAHGNVNTGDRGGNRGGGQPSGQPGGQFGGQNGTPHSGGWNAPAPAGQTPPTQTWTNRQPQQTPTPNQGWNNRQPAGQTPPSPAQNWGNRQPGQPGVPTQNWGNHPNAQQQWQGQPQNPWGSRGEGWNGNRNGYDNPAGQRRQWDEHRYAGNTPNRAPDRAWNRDWRRDTRYNWQGWRDGHRDTYHLGRYYPPMRSYSYRRMSIGFVLDPIFFGNSYVIYDPWTYRLPEVYGPYRWVRYYDDALLVDTFSGQVVDVIYGVFW